MLIAFYVLVFFPQRKQTLLLLYIDKCQLFETDFYFIFVIRNVL